MRSSWVVTLFLILRLNLSVPSAAQVLVVEQFADMEASAAATCPGEPWPESDFQKRWLIDLAGVNEEPTSQMQSPCGEILTRGLLSLSYGPDSIAASYWTTSVLDSLAGGYAQLTSYLRIEVASPTWYSIESTGFFVETGSPHQGGMP